LTKLIAITLAVLASATVVFAAPEPPPEDKWLGLFPIKLTWYDPQLGGINCDGDCSTLGNGQRVTEDLYGRSAACPLEWIGDTLLLQVSESETWALGCNEGGGAIKLTYNKDLKRMVVNVDILLHAPGIGIMIFEPENYYMWNDLGVIHDDWTRRDEVFWIGRNWRLFR